MTEEWKEAGYLRVTANTLVCPEPCYLLCAHLAAGAGGAATAVIRDGHNTNAEAVIDLASVASSFDFCLPKIPLLFKKGLYVDVGSNVTSVLVQYLPYKRGE